MSERIWAKIEIGGTLSRSISLYLAAEFGIPPLPARDSETVEVVRYLTMEDAEACWGQFERLEAYLVEQGIPFDRTSDGKYDISPEICKFRPGMINNDGSLLQPEIDRIFFCDHHNRPMAARSDIENAMVVTKTQEELMAHLVTLCGLDIPLLPGLNILEIAE